MGIPSDVSFKTASVSLSDDDVDGLGKKENKKRKNKKKDKATRDEELIEIRRKHDRVMEKMRKEQKDKYSNQPS